MRLDKFLAEAGTETRKKVRDYVKNGQVSVNGTIVIEPSYILDEYHDQVKIQGTSVIWQGKKYYMFHKPAGYITARSDENHRTVFDCMDDPQMAGLFPVGRLDKNTEGLLFLTNDGEFNHCLMYPDKHVEKKYFFWAFGSLSAQDMELLERGILLTGEEKVTKPASIQIEETGMFSELKGHMRIEEYGKKKQGEKDRAVFSGYLTISEGRKHQVKRMLGAFGCHVAYLKRVEVGGIELDKSLGVGEYRELRLEEIRHLFESTEQDSDSCAK